MQSEVGQSGQSDSRGSRTVGARAARPTLGPGSGQTVPIMDASTETPRAPRLVVGAAIVDDLDRPTTVLSARRTEPPELAGGWELPGGKVESGEELLDALHREIREELGVDIEVGAHLEGPSSGGHWSGGWPLGDDYLIHVWLARVTVGEPRALEDHDQLRVLTRAELYDVGWLPADRPIVDALAALMG